MVTSKVLDPALIILAGLAQKFLGELGMAADIAEEIDDLALAHQAQQMTIDDDAIKAVINPLHIRLKKLKKELHRRPPPDRMARVVFCQPADAFIKPTVVKSKALGLEATNPSEAAPIAIIEVFRSPTALSTSELSSTLESATGKFQISLARFLPTTTG